MRTAKNQGMFFFFFGFTKATRDAQYNKKLIINDTEATDQICIKDGIRDFYQPLFKKTTA